jgi:GNAT superfamily N-acetyltransferase
MSSYRFCRTDDIGLLVESLNRCWLPYFPGDGPMTAAAFKRSIRDLQVWCSSCMVAFSGSDPIGVLIGAKRTSATLVHRIAVHPDHVRQGHGRHLLASLGSKLAILGPPRLVTEVPAALTPACELFRASGYVQQAVLTDYVLDGGPPSEDHGAAPIGGLVIPVTVDDLAANDLLGEADRQVCWERSVETLAARKHELAGLAIASDERIEAYVLYVNGEAAGRRSEARAEVEGRKSETGDESGGRRSRVGAGVPEMETEIVALRSLVDDGARLRQLLFHLRARGIETLRFPKVHPGEVSDGRLHALGFRPGGEHLLYAATARSA